LDRLALGAGRAEPLASHSEVGRKQGNIAAQASNVGIYLPITDQLTLVVKTAQHGLFLGLTAYAAAASCPSVGVAVDRCTTSLRGRRVNAARIRPRELT